LERPSDAKYRRPSVNGLVGLSGKKYDRSLASQGNIVFDFS